MPTQVHWTLCQRRCELSKLRQVIEVILGSVLCLSTLTRASAIGSIGCSFNGGGGRNDAYQQKLQTDPMASQINQPLCVLQVTAVTQRIQVIEGAL